MLILNNVFHFQSSNQMISFPVIFANSIWGDNVVLGPALAFLCCVLTFQRLEDVQGSAVPLGRQLPVPCKVAPFPILFMCFPGGSVLILL